MSEIDTDWLRLIAGHHEANGSLRPDEANTIRAAADEIGHLRNELESLKMVRAARHERDGMEVGTDGVRATCACGWVDDVPTYVDLVASRHLAHKVAALCPGVPTP